MRKSVLLLICLCLAIGMSAQSKNKEAKGIPVNQVRELIIRLDDIGMCHAANAGAEKIFATGIPVSVSVMTVGPWFEEAVKIKSDIRMFLSEFIWL